MYMPELKYDMQGVPVISNKDLDNIGERLVLDFDPAMIGDPHEVDIDRFLEQYLGMNVDYMYLSHCGVYLGTMVFQTTYSLPVYIPEENRAEYAHVEAGTVILDASLDSGNQEHRYRFTAGHEAGHSILHTNFFLNSIGSNVGEDTGVYVRCRSDFRSYRANLFKRALNMEERIEQQANRLSAAILMPKNVVKLLLATRPYNHREEWVIEAIEKMVEVFNVSPEAAYYRLKDLEIIDNHLNYAWWR